MRTSSTKSRPRHSAGALICLVAGSVATASCNLDTTTPGQPRFAPAWQLVSVDNQPLPDTLALSLENSPRGTLHKIEAGALEFVFPGGSQILRWTLIVTRLVDTSRFAFTFDAGYYQFGADSIVFPRQSATLPSEFFGSKRTDTLTIAVVWSGDSASVAALVGGSHTWRFQRDTSIH
jgi:hypothetical protein